MLPPYEDIERLVQGFFDNTGRLFPYIHRPSFMETYHRAKQSGFTDVRRTWLGLLNIILAMATRADATRQDTNRVFIDSDIFYKRGEELCKTQMFRGTTLEIGKHHSNPVRLSMLSLTVLKCSTCYYAASICKALKEQSRHGLLMDWQ
jgi:hypothetical protein